MEALEDPDLLIQVQPQRPTNLDSALQVAQHMEAVMRTVTSKSSKPVRVVLQGAGDGWLEEQVRDLQAGQRHLLDMLQQLQRPDTVSRGVSRGGGAGTQRSPNTGLIKT